MVDTAKYEKHAADCLRRAQQTSLAEHKALLVMMAQAWVQVAEQTERLRSVLYSAIQRGHRR